MKNRKHDSSGALFVFDHIVPYKMLVVSFNIPNFYVTFFILFLLIKESQLTITMSIAFGEKPK